MIGGEIKTIVFILAIIGQIQPSLTPSLKLKSIPFPSQITITENLPLNKAEADFFDNPSHPLVQKIRFQSVEESYLCFG